jgi:hypothetical protein
VVSEDDEIRNVRAEEGRRGRRPIDIAARRRHLKLLESYRILLENCANEREFSDRIIADFGLVYGTREYVAALEVYRAYRAAK